MQREVAALLGVSPFTILGWEGARTTPLPKDCPAICRLLGYLPVPARNLAERLYAARFTNGWTQAEAAEHAYVGEDAGRGDWVGRRPSVCLTGRIEAALTQIDVRLNTPGLRTDR